VPRRSGNSGARRGKRSAGGSGKSGRGHHARSGRGLSIERGFDEVRFGPDRTLNLRAGLPTVAQAVHRAEVWLRERQVVQAGDVLVITGRGAGSPGGIPAIRDAIERLFPALRRQGVITEVRQHTEGSFAVRLASLRTLVEAPRRRRHPTPRPVRDPEALRALQPSTRALLRRLATVSLEALGVRTPTEAFIGDEMLRQFDRIAPSVPHGPVREAALRAALERAIEEYG
jgi:hypothetical protein